MTNVTIVDYGSGNLLSVCRAFEHVGAKPILTHDTKLIAGADRLVLPGVGAFGPAMETLRQTGLADALKECAVHRGRPFFGICLGMQMMLDQSSEFGDHAGLGLLAGRVERIAGSGIDGTPHPIPHIGWAPLKIATGCDGWAQSVLSQTNEGECAYFVHSYMSVPVAAEHIIAVADYDGLPVTATIGAGNMWGCQFHPEKSGQTGLEILKTFLEL